MGIISNVSRAVGAVADLVLFWQKKKPKVEAQKAAMTAREAVAKHDVEAVNRIVEESRLKRGGAVEVNAVALLAVMCASMAIVAGCVRTMVIPADREVADVTIEGVHYWLVPDATWADALEAMAREARLRQLVDVDGQ